MKLKGFSKSGAAVLAGAVGLSAALAAAYVAIPNMMAVSYTRGQEAGTSGGAVPIATTTAPVSAASSTVVHIAPPAIVKGIYMSQCAVGTPSFRKNLMDFIDRSDLNSVVIDIRDYTGKISFPTDDPVLKVMVSDACGARDMKQFIAELHAKHIYVIGRITTFQNPFYAKLHPELAVQKVGGGVWHDRKGLAFIDVGAKPYWDTVVELGKVSYYDMGFDELNFDYIRFPSDGNMSEADYSWDRGKTKAEAVEGFFKYLHDNLKPTGVILSADLFGYVTVHSDDLGIGQVLERAMPYFDYIDPMVYPSHYNSGFEGLKDVNSDPYKVVYVSIKTAVDRAVATSTAVAGDSETPIMTTQEVPAHWEGSGQQATFVATTTKQVASGLYSKAVYPAGIIRPWLQSFDYPVVYTPAMVSAQIKANIDGGAESYLFWDAANRYTALKQVLEH